MNVGAAGPGQQLGHALLARRGLGQRAEHPFHALGIGPRRFDAFLGAAQLAESVRIPVIAAGGVRSLDDIRALCAVADSGVVGGITGRAIYEGTLDFAAGQALADELSGGD